MANLRAGLVGMGMMGRHHARVLGSLEGVDLVGIVDPDGDKFKAAGGRPVYDTVDQLLERCAGGRRRRAPPRGRERRCGDRACVPRRPPSRGTAARTRPTTGPDQKDAPGARGVTS